MLAYRGKIFVQQFMGLSVFLVKTAWPDVDEKLGSTSAEHLISESTFVCFGGVNSGLLFI